MDLTPETDEYIREYMEPVSTHSLQLKLLASQDDRRRLQDRIFFLQDHLAEAERRLEQFRAEASMSARGLRRCVEEKVAMVSGYADLVGLCHKLEDECALYEQDIERSMESCDELARQNEELRAQLREALEHKLQLSRNILPIFEEPLDDLAFWMSIHHSVSEVGSLRKDKEHLKINLHRAEERVKILFGENNMLDEENKRLLKQLSKERHNQAYGGKHSVSASTKVRKI